MVDENQHVNNAEELIYVNMAKKNDIVKSAEDQKYVNMVE